MVDEPLSEPQELIGETIELIGPDDERLHYEVVDFLSIEDADYAICAPAEEEGADLYPFRIVVEDASVYLKEIEDEAEWERVAQAWEQERAF